MAEVPSAAKAPRNELPCASARIDITPPAPVALAGVEGRDYRWRAVASPLEANALLFGGGSGRVLILSADLLYFGPDLVAAVALRAAKHGVSRDRIVFAASHTHFAPATDRTKPRLGAVDPFYLQFLEIQLCKLVDAVTSATPTMVRVEASRAPSEANVNRRRRWPLPTLTREGFRLGPSIIMAPAPESSRDAFIDVFRLVDASGTVRGVLWKFACHPVCFPESDNVSSEYPGRARSRLRQHLGADIPVVFLQGFAGDVRPRLVGARSLGDRIHALRRGPGFGEVSITQWREWADGIAALLCEVVLAREVRDVTASADISTVEIPIFDLLDRSMNPQAAGRTMRIQRLTFGNKLEILTFGAEVCSPYLSVFSAGADTWCAAYAGDVFGYLPSEQQATEGGYEGSGYFARFGLFGALRPGFERCVVAGVERLRADAGQRLTRRSSATSSVSTESIADISSAENRTLNADSTAARRLI